MYSFHESFPQKLSLTRTKTTLRIQPAPAQGPPEQSEQKRQPLRTVPSQQPRLTTLGVTHLMSASFTQRMHSLPRYVPSFHSDVHSYLSIKYAEATYTFRFPGVKDSDESFNAPVYGRLVLVNNDKKKIQALLSDMDTALAVPVAA